MRIDSYSPDQSGFASNRVASYTDEAGTRFASGRKSSVVVTIKRRLDNEERHVHEGVIKRTLSKPKDVRKSIRTILSRPNYTLSLRTPAYGRLVAA